MALVRTGVRRIPQLADRLSRRLLFRRAMRRFRQDPVEFTDPAHPVFFDLVRGWGNFAWSAKREFLAASIHQALLTEGPILECGSGLSTVLVGYVAQTRGIQLWALEDSEEWAGRVERELERFRIDSARVVSTPLRDYGEFAWYTPPLSALPESFALVLCDGPPGRTKGGRYGLVPVMGDRLAAPCTILLDDANRDVESSIVARWSQELHASSSLLGTHKLYYRLDVNGRPAAES